MDGLNLKKELQKLDQACAECAFRVILNNDTKNFRRIEMESDDMSPGEHRKFHFKGVQTLIIREINGLTLKRRSEFLWDILLNGRYIGIVSLQRK